MKRLVLAALAITIAASAAVANCAPAMAGTPRAVAIQQAAIAAPATIAPGDSCWD